MLRRQLKVMDDLSPALQIKVVEETISRWNKKVPIITGADRNLALMLFKSMVINLYQPTEVIHGYRRLFVVERGVCTIHGRLLFTGHSWGEDFQLENDALRRNAQVTCLTFVETRSLTFAKLTEHLREFPSERERLRKAKNKLALLRGVLGLREPGATSSSKFCGLVFNAAAVDCNGQEAPTRKLSDPLEVQTP
jgi:hypothetical protein